LLMAESIVLVLELLLKILFLPGNKQHNNIIYNVCQAKTHFLPLFANHCNVVA